MNPFQEMFETNNPYKWICLVYSITILAAITPLLCLVIHFLNENPYTTLVQQVFSIIIGVTIATNILIHIPLILLYILGPFSQRLDIYRSWKFSDSIAFISKHPYYFKIHVYFHFEEPFGNTTKVLGTLYCSLDIFGWNFDTEKLFLVARNQS